MEYPVPPESSWRTNTYRYSTDNPVLEAIGLGLWAGEGSKEAKRVEVTNCDHRLLRLWLQYLLEVCGISPKDLVLRINLHDPSHGDEASEFWDQQLGVNLRKQITAKKTVVPNPKNKQLMGTCSIRFNSRFLREHIEHRLNQMVALVPEVY